MQFRTKKLIQYITPSIISAVSIFLFTIVDGIFVGRGVGTDALGAVNIAFPFVMIFTALIMLTTVGGLTITAIRFGRGDSDGANQAFVHSAVTTIAIGVAMTAIGTLLTGQVARAMGASDTFYEYTVDYLFWYSVFLIPCGMCTLFSGYIRNDGNPVFASIITIVATTLNIFGDWLLIFPLKMGLKGAAIATGVAQTVAFVLALFHFILKKGRLRFKKVSFDRSLLFNILRRGLPECVSQFSVPICTICMNIMLVKYIGDVGVNAFSVIMYVAVFSAAIFIGVSEGLQPLFGNSYGEKNEKDLKFYYRSGVLISFVGSLIINIILFFVGTPICALYGVDEATMNSVIAQMPKYLVAFVFQSVTVVISSYLYSTTKTGGALVVNTLRSFVVNTLVILLMPVVFGSEALWYAFAVYEGIMMVIALIVRKFADRNGVIGTADE